MVRNICGRLLACESFSFHRIPLETHLSCEVLKVENDEEPAASNGLRARKAHANARDRAQKCEQGAARYKRRTSRARGRERTTMKRGQRQRRGPEEPRMKDCEGVLNETHSNRYHEICSSPLPRTLSPQRGNLGYICTHTYTHTRPHTHTHQWQLGVPTEITVERIGAFR